MKSSAELSALVPPGVVTVTSTVLEPAGLSTSISPAVSLVGAGAFVEPNLTSLAPLRFVPLIVTLVPPVVGAEDGSTSLTVGAGM